MQKHTKNEKNKSPHRIDFLDVCEFISDQTYKNIIAYKLLTNVKNLDPYSTKYGYFIKVNEKLELFYLDPCYAIKDLKHLKLNVSPTDFRFKIQQVGLTNLNSPTYSFRVVFSFDLKAVETQYQNDKVFADALFVFDDSYSDEISEDFISESDFSRADISAPNQTEFEIKNIAEDTVERNTKDFEEINISQTEIYNKSKIKIDALKFSLGIENKQDSAKKKAAFSSFVEKHRINFEEKSDDKKEIEKGIDIFANSSKSKIRKESVVLKFKQ